MKEQKSQIADEKTVETSRPNAIQKNLNLEDILQKETDRVEEVQKFETKTTEVGIS
jgi:hypothetical protein